MPAHTQCCPAIRCLQVGLLGLAIVCQPCAAAQDAHDVTRGEMLDQWMSRMEAFGMSGAVLVERGGEVILAEGYGIADERTGRRITADTMFHLGSLGKQFTAAAILKLQMRGTLDVNDPITSHIDDVPDDKRLITIHHLLTHTAGLPYQPGGGDALDLPLQSAPGERFSYSNPGYALLARIIDRRSGMPMEQFFQTELFEPAGMQQTACVGAADWPSDDVARAYTDQTDQGLVSQWSANPSYRGAGDVASTVHDLMKWEHALRNHTVLDEPSTDMFFSEHVRNEGSNVGYAYGWMTIETIRGTRLVMHAGNLGGYNTDYRRYLDEDLTIIFLSNRFNDGRSMRDAVMNNVSMLINGGDVPQPPSVIACAEDELARVSGTWLDEAGAQYEVAVAPDGQGLSVRASGSDAMQRVFAPDAPEPVLAWARQCEKAAAAIVEGAFAGDDQPLREHIAAALPFTGAWQSIRQMTGQLARAHGTLRSCETLGAAIVGGGQSLRAVVRVQLEDDEALVQLTFGRDGVLHMTRVEQTPARLFLPTATNVYTAFDIFSGAAQVLTLVGDDELRIGEADDASSRSLRRPAA